MLLAKLDQWWIKAGEVVYGLILVITKKRALATSEATSARASRDEEMKMNEASHRAVELSPQ